MSMWHQDLELITTDELEGLCDELEMKLDEGRAELVRREEEDDMRTGWWWSIPLRGSRCTVVSQSGRL